METLFSVSTSPVGSSKAITESLVLSRWRDYLQDIEEGEDSIALSDILFFATGCKVLPPRKISPVIEFLHEAERWGQSRFPTANTCSCTLRLPVVHTTYGSFKADMTFGIQNGRGFGTTWNLFWDFSPHYVHLVPRFILLLIIHFGMTEWLLRANEFCSGFTTLLIFHERVTLSISVMYDCTLCS